MLKIIFIFILSLTVVSGFSQPKQLKSLSSAKDESYTADNQGNLLYVFAPTIHNPYAPVGTVTFPINYNDYVTNGNNMRRLVVLGDTIIVAADINPDKSGPPPVSTSNHVYYQVSYNAGLTWLTNALNTSPAISNRWTNIMPIYNSGFRDIVFTGRQNTTTAHGLVMVETLLGLGSITSYVTSSTYDKDFFGCYKNSSLIGGVIPDYQYSGWHFLWYMDFNYLNGSYLNPSTVYDSTNIDGNQRYFCDIANNGQNIVVARWKSWGIQAYYIYESTNGGMNWSNATLVGYPQLVNGDSCRAWLSFDIIYKPGTTQKCLAFATLSPSNTITRKGSKILFWSPNINGGNPVVVCDYHKYYYMNDTAYWNHSKINMQVGMSPFSHPTLAYSNDGTALFCAFSIIQPDTSNYAIDTNFHFNNIAICKSTNDGASWSNPYYITNTPRRDETYPSLAKKGNTSSLINIVYSESGSPGSFTFTDNAPPDTVYTVFKRMTVITNINNNTNEIPEYFNLYQNYPNPFNPTTKIKFEIPVGQRHAFDFQNNANVIQLKVFDITGREIATLVNEQLKPGTYEVNFDGGNLPSGIYFYQLRTDYYIDTKKMLMIK